MNQTFACKINYLNKIVSKILKKLVINSIMKLKFSKINKTRYLWLKPKIINTKLIILLN